MVDVDGVAGTVGAIHQDQRPNCICRTGIRVKPGEQGPQTGAGRTMVAGSPWLALKWRTNSSDSILVSM